LGLLPDETVVVRRWQEVQATLDERGCHDGLPFMPEMLPFCGRRFHVWRRIEKTCVEGDRVRRMRNVVLLDALRCDGTAHDGCEKECALFWHESWLERCSHDPNPKPDASPRPPEPVFPYPVKQANGRYICQSTELLGATQPLSKADLRQYFRDLRTRTWSPARMCRFVWAAFRLRLKVVFRGVSSVKLRGTARPTPTATLDLERGDWVEVKRADEIALTLDRHGRNRGLQFPVHMLPFCGERYRVRKRVGRIILETTGEMRDIKHTVILEGVTCDGYGRWGGCPRDAHHLWREIWLKRIPAGVGPAFPARGDGGSEVRGQKSEVRG